MAKGVKCEDCKQLPEIANKCGDNGSSTNGCEYRLECRCGGKDQPWYKSQLFAVSHWESEGYKSKNVCESATNIEVI